LNPEQILSELIKINTVNPPGNEIEGAKYLQRLFEDYGISGEIIESEKGRGNFIARLGSGPKKMLFLSHLDVVPAGEDWDFSPLSGEIADGMVYGRGALDCKDLMAAQVSAMLQLHREGALLDGELIFAATADEEAGGKMGVKYLLDHYPEKLEADFAINEGAIHPVTVKSQNNGQKRICFVQVGEKGTAWNKITTRGKAGHGSLPTLADNAVTSMAAAVNSLQGYRAQVNLLPEVKHLLEELARLQGISTNLDGEKMSNQELGSEIDSLLANLNLEVELVEMIRAMTRMTVSPNVIKGGNKTNTVPDQCEAELDVRILPGESREYVVEELRRYIGEDKELEFIMYREPTFSSADLEYYELIESTTREVLGEEILCLPHISTGSTDSNYLRRWGIPAYGIGIMAEGADPKVGKTIHGKNERTDVESVRVKAEFISRLARNYLGR